MFKMARDQYRAKVDTVVHRFYITGEIGDAAPNIGIRPVGQSKE